MQLYSKYIFKKTTATFLAITTVLICLIWFSRAISFLKYVTENGVKLSQFFYLFVLILPWILQFIIPVSLFIAVLSVYNRLTYSNEITILKNSGLTKIAISTPAIRLAIICSFFCLFISLYLMPFANKELRKSRVNIANNYTSLAFSPQTFETINNITIYAKNRDEQNNLYGIILNDQREENYTLTITAKKGNIVMEESSALLYMEDGTVQRFNIESKKSEILSFDNYVFNLTEAKQNELGTYWKAKERYLHELLYPEDEVSEVTLNKFWVEVIERFTYPLLPIMFSLIALGSILRGSFNRRGNITNVLAISLNSGFFILFIASLNLAEKSRSFTFVPYLLFVIFGLISFGLLASNYRRKPKAEVKL